MINIAIDGPGGAGKSSVAKAVASRLGIIYVDTGALYRTVGYYVRKKNVDPHDAQGVAALLPEIDLEIKFEDGTQWVYLNGENLGDKIREPEISMYASAVSAIPTVREFLLETQRSIARANSVVMDGRDIGTAVFPDAELKIFVVASAEIRAQRRYDELQAKGQEASFDEILANVKERDYIDQNREVSPLRQAEDALLLDNSNLTIEEQKQWLAAEFQKAING